MIGFQSRETDTNESNVRAAETAPDPGTKEVPAEKPGKEIITPAPSSIPAPRPDTINTSPETEITSIPAETPESSPVPEIVPDKPVEFS